MAEKSRTDTMEIGRSRTSVECSVVSVSRQSSRGDDRRARLDATSYTVVREDDCERTSPQRYCTPMQDRESYHPRETNKSPTVHKDTYEHGTIERTESVQRRRATYRSHERDHLAERQADTRHDCSARVRESSTCNASGTPVAKPDRELSHRYSGHTPRDTAKTSRNADANSGSRGQERECTSIDSYCVSADKRRVSADRERVSGERDMPTPRTRAMTRSRQTDFHSSERAFERASVAKYTERDLRKSSGTGSMPTSRHRENKEHSYVHLDAPTPCRRGELSGAAGKSRTSIDKRTPESSTLSHNTLLRYFVDEDANTQDGVGVGTRADKKTPSPAVKDGSKHDRPKKVDNKKPAQRRKKKEAVVDPNQSSLLDYGYRRSRRKTQSEVKQKNWLLLEKRILEQDESHLEIYEDEVMGKGLRCKINLIRGDFVCEYSGDLIDPVEADSVDATVAGRKGRLINHNKKLANVHTKAFLVVDTPRLCFFASRDISAGEELQYDYGDRRKEVIRAMPWLAQ
ncbi:hypothetical protein SARC_03923 [Sphaeroforma arctica JP610]|uniref:SET domain-containing protein n=1 Tax=Sphaeroforma arctica JP610 TaxID=667725 RepID=A0A0L0G4V2_9EUKA|nr:hypothetical protein SARC_03923 [Sphaeroforma arctica JP610]KNC83841.1 hypothetical protein SARC_03923 [Sphaeroforma arctica JP610]|eukprot:XP_014157743.1 hypothetical protein SARC_03923 [Sphaeroforma arctica JP610]